MISEAELYHALTKVHASHPHVCSDMGRQFLETLGRRLNLDRAHSIARSFGENIRLALNEKDIRDNREAYRKLAGYYYGSRGNRQRQSPTKKPSLTVADLEITEEPSGQLRFVT